MYHCPYFCNRNSVLEAPSDHMGWQDISKSKIAQEHFTQEKLDMKIIRIVRITAHVTNFGDFEI